MEKSSGVELVCFTNVDIQQSAAESILYYHDHIHYSAKRRGEKGPKLTDEVSKINSTIRQWYARIDDLLANTS